MIIKGLDWLNPVLVREYLQFVRSRSFLWICSLWLVGQLVVSAVFLSDINPQAAALTLEGPGQEYFGSLMVGFGLLFLVVLPIASFNRMVRERREATLELLVISRITAGQIAAGFLSVAFAQIVLICFLSFPFVVFAYLFRGLDLATVMWSFYFMVLAALAVNAASLMLSSFCKTARAVTIMRVFIAVGLILMIGPGIEFFSFTLSLTGPHGGSSLSFAGIPWTAGAVVGGLAAIAILICFVFARSNLLFESANRSTMPRVTMTVCLLLVSVTLGVLCEFGRIREEWLGVFAVFAFFVFLAYGMLLLNESNQLSRRAHEELPRRPIWRWLGLPFWPGRGTGFVYLLMNLAIIFAVFWYAVGDQVVRNPATPDWQAVYLSSLGLYAVFFLGVASLVHHCLQKTRLRRAPYFAWFVLGFCIVLWLPVVLMMWTRKKPLFWLFVLDPGAMSPADWQVAIFWNVVVAPLIGIVCALPAIIHSVRNLQRQPAPPFPTAAPPLIEPGASLPVS
jgi:hypothetical protein